MKLNIKIKYSNPKDNVLEMGFYKGEKLLHNVFLDVSGLSDDELLELKKESCAKFITCFPEISLKEVMKGFKNVDESMYQLYKETYNPKGAGRKVGTKKAVTKKMYSFRLSKEEETAVRELLKRMRNR